MELLHERCAGLDIGKKDLKACVRVPSPSGKRSRRQEIRTFATTTNALLELRDWLVAEKVTLVVMEATGDYVQPVGRFTERHLTVRGIPVSEVQVDEPDRGVPSSETIIKAADFVWREVGVLLQDNVPFCVVGV
jgi:hypothetical protein